MGDCKDRCSKIVPIGRSPLYSTGAIVILESHCRFQEDYEIRDPELRHSGGAGKVSNHLELECQLAEADACPLECSRTAIPTQRRRAVEDISGMAIGSLRRLPARRQGHSTTEEKESSI
jgi:hypothetical protein